MTDFTTKDTKGTKGTKEVELAGDLTAQRSMLPRRVRRTTGFTAKDARDAENEKRRGRRQARAGHDTRLQRDRRRAVMSRAAGRWTIVVRRLP